MDAMCTINLTIMTISYTLTKINLVNRISSNLIHRFVTIMEFQFLKNLCDFVIDYGFYYCYYVNSKKFEDRGYLILWLSSCDEDEYINTIKQYAKLSSRKKSTDMEDIIVSLATGKRQVIKYLFRHYIGNESSCNCGI